MDPKWGPAVRFLLAVTGALPAMHMPMFGYRSCANAARRDLRFNIRLPLMADTHEFSNAAACLTCRKACPDHEQVNASENDSTGTLG